MRVSCLHTSPESIAAYEAAAPKGMQLTHHLRADLEARVRASGLDEGLTTEIRMHLDRISPGSDAVLLTSLHLARAATPGTAADTLLAEELSQAALGQSVDVIYTDPDDAFAVGRLFGAVEGASSVRLVPLSEAHEKLVSGDRTGHDLLVRRAIETSDARLIVLANPDLGRIAQREKRVFTAPRVALRRILEKAPHQS